MTNCVTPNSPEAQKAQLASSIPHSGANHGNSPEAWKPLGDKTDGGQVRK